MARLLIYDAYENKVYTYANLNENDPIDNVDYGRYMGELQIDLCPLPADPRVNVVAQVCEPDLALLPYAADPAYQFEFCE